MKHYDVVCAVIVNDGQVLCMQRPWRGSESTAGKWEFPGGKIEKWTDAEGKARSEKPEDACQRELHEEMDYEVSVVKPLAKVEYQYPDFSISLQAFLCKADTRVFNRKEHIDHRWLRPEELTTLDWAKADETLISILQSSLSSAASLVEVTSF